MHTIWKFNVRRAGEGDFDIRAPRGAKPLSVQLQRGKPVLWMLVDDEAPVEAMSFQVFGTGWDIDPPLGYTSQFVGTWQDIEGYAWHLFRLKGVA